MQRQHNIADAKAHLTELLRCVERGEGVIITRRGKGDCSPIANSADCSVVQSSGFSCDLAMLGADSLRSSVCFAQ